MFDQILINVSFLTDFSFSVNFSSLVDLSLLVNQLLSQILIDQFDVLSTSNQLISDQILLVSVSPALSKFNKHSRKQILFFLIINSVKKSHKIKFSKSNAQQNTLQNIQQNKQEIQMKVISESDFM